MLSAFAAKLTLLTMLAHVLLGCCAHHAHHVHARETHSALELMVEYGCCAHAHAAEEDGHPHPPGHDCPRECDQQDCQFVVSNDGKLLDLAAAADSIPAFAAALSALAPRADFLLPPRPPLWSLSGGPCALRAQNWVQVWRL
jgi:hypothetical protein